MQRLLQNENTDMLTDIEIDEYYKSRLKYFINESDKILDMSLNNKQSNILVDVTDKRILAVGVYSASVRALSSFDKQVVYSYVFDSMKNVIQRNLFSRNKSWRMRVSDDGFGWTDSPNIVTTTQLEDYILTNQKVALLDEIHAELDRFRRVITKGTTSQQNIYFSKFLEAKYIIDNNIQEDTLLEYPYTTGYAEVNNLSLQEAAKRVLFKHDTEATRLAENENLRLRYTYLIRDEVQLENLKTIHNSFLTENTKYSNL